MRNDNVKSDGYRNDGIHAMHCRGVQNFMEKLRSQNVAIIPDAALVKNVSKITSLLVRFYTSKGLKVRLFSKSKWPPHLTDRSEAIQICYIWR